MTYKGSDNQAISSSWKRTAAVGTALALIGLGGYIVTKNTDLQLNLNTDATKSDAHQAADVMSQYL